METTWIGIVALAFFKIIPLAILAWLIRARRIDTVEVRSRERRTLPFLLGSLSMAFGSAVFFLMGTDISRLVAVLAAVSVLSAGILTVITLRWKISVHASAAGAFAGLALYFAINTHAVHTVQLNPGYVAIIACMLLPAVSWARVRTDAHTPAQVVVGSVFGFFMSIVPLYWLLGT